MSRRSPGEGTLPQRPRRDGRWAAAITLPSGRRKWFYGRTRAEVRRKLEAARQALAAGIPIDAGSVTLERYLQVWLDQVARPRVRPRTYEHYHHYVTHHLVPALGRVRLGQLRPQQIQAYLHDAGERGLAPRTVHHLRAILRNALATAVRWGLLATNPAALAEPVAVPQLERPPMGVALLRQVLAAVSEDRWGVVYALALATGLRQGEVLGLTWEDLDLEAGMLVVRHQLQRHAHSYTLVEPKTARSLRAVPIPPGVIAQLRVWRDVQAEWRTVYGPGNAWDLVFTRPDGAPLSGASVTHHLQELLGRAGLPRLRFQDLRVAHNTVLAELGVDIAVRMARLGHGVARTNLLHYTTRIPGAQRQATELLAAALWSD